MFKPVLITYTVPEPAPNSRFYHSLHKHGWELMAYIQPGFGGWIHKFEAPFNIVKSLRGSDYTHAIFLDAFDVVVKRDIKAAEEALNRLGNPALVLAAETNVYPDKSLEPLYPKIKSIFRYVNAQYCIRLDWNRLDEFGHMLAVTDQDHMAKFYLNNLNNPDVVLDSNCELFQCLYQTKKEMFDNYRNTLTNTHPVFFHGNGKADMSWIEA